MPLWTLWAQLGVRATAEVVEEAGEQRALINAGCEDGWVQSRVCSPSCIPSPSPGMTASDDNMVFAWSMSRWQLKLQLLLPMHLSERTWGCVGCPPAFAAPRRG